MICEGFYTTSVLQRLSSPVHKSTTVESNTCLSGGRLFKKKISTATGRNQSLGESTKDVKVNFTHCLSPYTDFQWADDIPALTLGMLGLAPAPPEIPIRIQCARMNGNILPLSGLTLKV